MTLPLFRRQPQPRPQLVSWTNHYRVRDGRTWAQDAYVLFPGEQAARLVPVRLSDRTVEVAA